MEEYRSHFDKRVVQVGDCLIWQGACYPNGLPYIEIKKRKVAARRASWVLAGGAFYCRSFRVTCGNPLCVNPDHLRPAETISSVGEEPYGERLGRGQRMIDGDLGRNHSVDVVRSSVRSRDSFV